MDGWRDLEADAWKQACILSGNTVLYYGVLMVLNASIDIHYSSSCVQTENME